MNTENITTAAVTCSACGKTYTDELELQEFYEVAFFGGYASIFGDGAHVYGDFCQACIKRLLGEFLEITQPKYLEELSYSDISEALTFEELMQEMDKIKKPPILKRLKHLLQDIADRVIQ